MPNSDDETDRLMKLLDIGLEALKRDDDNGAIMALKAATEVANNLPRKPTVICLPDGSK